MPCSNVDVLIVIFWVGPEISSNFMGIICAEFSNARILPKVTALGLAIFDTLMALPLEVADILIQRKACRNFDVIATYSLGSSIPLVACVVLLALILIPKE